MQAVLFACAATVAPLLAQDCSEPLWSMQPLLPATNAVSPARIDALVEAKLEQQQILRTGQADPRTRLRRAAAMLTGLPPTPAQVEAFCADPSKERFAAEVDRMLASLECAEHLARRWLDLARYSDSNGLDENLAFANAYRYRDWVVDAFFADLPFDRFGTLQLAGDCLPPEDSATPRERIVPTGFLALGPRMLAEQDKEKLVLDTVDEQVDLVGRTFLGLTLGCARCHDHKFDPVPTSDYYALAGIFKSSKSFSNLDHVSQWLEKPIASDVQVAARAAAVGSAQAAHQALVAFDKAQEEELEARLEVMIEPALQAAFAQQGAIVAVQAEDADLTNLAVDRNHWGADGCVIVHTAAVGTQFAEYGFLSDAGEFTLDIRFAAKEARPFRILIDGIVAEARAGDRTTGGWKPEHQLWTRAGTHSLEGGKHVLRIESLGPHVPHLDRWILMPVATKHDVDEVPPVIVRNAAFLLADRRSPLWRDVDAQKDEDGKRNALARKAEVLRSQIRHKAQPPVGGDGAIEHRLLHGLGGFLELDPEDRKVALPASASAQRERLVAAESAAQAAVPAEIAQAICIADGEPVDLPVHIRGNHLALAAEKTPRGALTALVTAMEPLTIGNGSGRLQLARWIFDAKNPLTPRVTANRVWQVAFGEGLVRSESNFGKRGDEPTHRQLLDELASSLVADGWSIRRLLRTIVLSQTWQQASRADDAAEVQDPDNRLFWRWSRQRLPAEAVRDAILATAGTLDRTRGGSLLSVGNRGYVTNDQSGDGARYDAPRRSLYLPVIRNSMYELFTVFDYADPSVHIEQRPQSTVSLQALLLMNSPFALAQRKAFAEAATIAEPDAARRIDWIWRRALQRPPSERERAAAQQWLADAADVEAWPGVCQALFATSEFVFVD